MVTARPNFQDSIHVGFVSGLKKFTEYFTSVLCFTTPGDGPRSTPQLVRTHEDGRQHAAPAACSPPFPPPPKSQAGRSGHRAVLVLSPTIPGRRGHSVRCLADSGLFLALSDVGWGGGPFWGTVPGPVGHLSFTEILDTSLKVSWQEPGEKNGILTGRRLRVTEPGPGKGHLAHAPAFHLASTRNLPAATLRKSPEEAPSPSTPEHTPVPQPQASSGSHGDSLSFPQRPPNRGIAPSAHLGPQAPCVRPPRPQSSRRVLTARLVENE